MTAVGVVQVGCAGRTIFEAPPEQDGGTDAGGSISAPPGLGGSGGAEVGGATTSGSAGTMTTAGNGASGGATAAGGFRASGGAGGTDTFSCDNVLPGAACSAAQGGVAGAEEPPVCWSAPPALGPYGPLERTDPTADTCTVPLPGDVDRLVYDAASDVAYGLDPTNGRISAVDLSTGAAVHRCVARLPNAACVDTARSRLWVANLDGYSLTEYSLVDLRPLRDIPWTRVVANYVDDYHFHVHCAPDRVYVVDAGWAPGLWTVEDLDTCPWVEDHTDDVFAIGDLVVTPDGAELYYWYQYGWVAGLAGSNVYRVSTSNWSVIDETGLEYADGFHRDPLDTPILLDPSRSLVFAKNRVYSSEDLSSPLLTITTPEDGVADGALENAHALDQTCGRFATRHHVYSIPDFSTLADVEYPIAYQYFFDTRGWLRALDGRRDQLDCQVIP